MIIGQSNMDKVCRAEFELGRHIPSEMFQQATNKRRKLSPTYSDEIKQSMKTLWVISSPKRIIADDRACNLRLQANFGLKAGPIFTKSGGLKSCDCKQLSFGILKYCLSGMLRHQQRTTLFLLLDCIFDICGEQHDASTVDTLAERVNVALALYECDWPLGLQNITTHLLHHIVPSSIKWFGPIYGTWMYAFERFNSFICKRILNKRFPENAAIETYRVYDWVPHMKKMYRKLFANISNSDGLAVYHENMIARDMKQLIKICKDKFSGQIVTMSPRTVTFVTINNHTYTSKQRCNSKLIPLFIYEISDTSLLCSVPVEPDAFVRFGQVMLLVDNAMVNLENTYLAKVAWCADAHFDSDTNLWFALSNNNGRPSNTSFIVMGTTCISNPLVTANEKDKCWFIRAGSSWPRLRLCRQ